MSTTEIFLIAMILILGIPFLIWRLLRTDYYAPLVVVQIITGILLGPGVLGAALPEYHRFVFSPPVIQTLNGIGWWAVMIFVWIAGIELDIGKAWQQKRETSITAGLAFATPMLLGSVVGVSLLAWNDGWIGGAARPWQFVLGVGMSCAVTALPILILLMEKLEILRKPLGGRILRYASVDDVAIWSVLGLILMDWQRLSRQLVFLLGFTIIAAAFRRLMPRLSPGDRWYVSLVWLAAVGFTADWCGMHFMVGAFLAGLVMNASWFEQAELDAVRRFVLLTGMPVFFLSTGLRTQWGVGGAQVFVAAAALLAAGVIGKLMGVQIAGKLLGWRKGEASLIGWLLQTKALIMIIFANVLLDRQVITNDTFTALLLMAVASTMLTIPMVLPKLQRAQARSEALSEANEAAHAPGVAILS